MSPSSDKVRRMNRMNYLNFLIVGFVILAVLCILWIIGYKMDDKLLTSVLAIGLASLGAGLTGYLRYRIAPDVPVADERTQKLGYMAIVCSWLLSFGFVGVLGFLTYAGIIKISAWYALGATGVFMAVSAILLGLLFRMRGTKEK